MQAHDEDATGDDDESELSQDGDEENEASTSSTAADSASHRRLKEGSAVNATLDGPIAEMDELSLGGGSAPSSGLIMPLILHQAATPVGMTMAVAFQSA